MTEQKIVVQPQEYGLDYFGAPAFSVDDPNSMQRNVTGGKRDSAEA